MNGIPIMIKMKNIILSFFVLFAFLPSAFGTNTNVRAITIEDHRYIVATIEGFETRGGICIVHAESCQCKSNLVSKASTSEPRLFSRYMRIRKYEEQNGICTHCTNRFEFSEMEGDHIIPYSNGGKTIYENLQMLCRPCNRKKGNRYDY